MKTLRHHVSCTTTPPTPAVRRPRQPTPPTTAAPSTHCDSGCCEPLRPAIRPHKRHAI
jgi:hypothetical protein